MNMHLFVDAMFRLDEYDVSFDKHDMQVYTSFIGYDNMLI